MPKPKRPSDCPPGGPLHTTKSGAAYLKIVERQLQRLFEQNIIPSFKQGSRRYTTQAALDQYVVELIAEEQARMDALVVGDDEPRRGPGRPPKRNSNGQEARYQK